MTKDRIKHFDDVVMKTRVHGIPIATAMQIAAFVTAQNIGGITTSFFGLSVFSLIIIASLVYLVPVLLLDIVHFVLLLRAVKHAKNIESISTFKDNLRITHQLSDTKLTILHSVGGYLIYAFVFLGGLFFAFYGVNDILPLFQQ